ncbi:hypothetical protein O3M35_004671 [Rhynocoris fuscipes]|uniref:G-protein coupled receptors family 3 profile domain-containing protein n=1 Tax=Rhynocoris fuscipes TaxID=488301 RepID=A0AAW1CGG1_9HEMI
MYSIFIIFSYIIVYLTFIQSAGGWVAQIRHSRSRSSNLNRHNKRSDTNWLLNTATTINKPILTSTTTTTIKPTTTTQQKYQFETTIESERVYEREQVPDNLTRLLRTVEQQLGDNCTAGTDLNLGEGVVDRYAQERFQIEAEVAVNRANMLTRLWKYAPETVLNSEYLLHAGLFSMVEFDEDIFAAGNCYDINQYKDFSLFCPYAYRLPEGPILVKDLAVEYKYADNEWFYIARNNAHRVISNYNHFSRGYNSYTWNDSAHTERVADEILSVVYEDGKWSKPYYDCGGGNIWMLTYTVPFFGYSNGTYFFKGTSGIDIDLRRVDIDQCPLPAGASQLNIFAGSDKCKKRTTECVPIAGLGFRRGSYKCVCKQGFYYPDTKAIHRFYNGSLIEEEYEKLMMVVRAASPVLLRVIILGAFFIYCTTIVMYPRPNVISCSARVWLREIGFSLTYGALMLKTWRISVIFRVRSAKAVKITDIDLLKRLGMMVSGFMSLLVIRTLVSPPLVIVGKTADDLKAYLCQTDWWDHSFTTIEVIFLVWGIRLCIVVRKAPSEFNESRFISLAIYNEFLLSLFLNISMLFLQSPANPDLLYIIFFCHTQMTVTLLLCFIFGSKAYIVLKGGGRDEDTFSTSPKVHITKFLSKPKSGNSHYVVSTNSSTLGPEIKLTEQDIQEELKRLYIQLEHLKEKNLRYGNKEVAGRIVAMQEAVNCDNSGGLREDKGCWTGTDLVTSTAAPVSTRPSTPELTNQAEKLVAILEPPSHTDNQNIG